MKIGTKSFLFGAHQFLIHPIYVFRAWVQLYGWPPLRALVPLLVACFVHDSGYWGRPNLDGPEGITHPELGGLIMDCLFGKRWGDFTRYHSGSYARLRGAPVSPLCAADKLATTLVPAALYLIAVAATGELAEYMENARRRGRLARNRWTWWDGLRYELEEEARTKAWPNWAAWFDEKPEGEPPHGTVTIPPPVAAHD